MVIFHGDVKLPEGKLGDIHLPSYKWMGRCNFFLRRQYSDSEASEAGHQNDGSHQRAWEHHADIDGKTMKTGWWFQTC